MASSFVLSALFMQLCLIYFMKAKVSNKQAIHLLRLIYLDYATTCSVIGWFPELDLYII